jgi:tellurite resistance-related uncharacterized protein
MNEQTPPARAITGFERDADGVWTARLSCGHAQHVRHDPPWQSRPWVESAEGRAAQVGKMLPCKRCLMPALPPHVAHTRSTPEYDERSLPAGLRSAHTLREGSWARIVILRGRLLYVIEGTPELTFILDPGFPGIVEPQVPHHVEPRGEVTLRIDFYRTPEE